MKTDKQKFKNDLTKKLEDTFGKDFVNEKIIIDINEDEENESCFVVFFHFWTYRRLSVSTCKWL